MIRRPPRSTPFPTRRSSDLSVAVRRVRRRLLVPHQDMAQPRMLRQRVEERHDRAAGIPEDHLRSEEHTSELQSRLHLVCRLLLEKKKNTLSLSSMRSHETSN